MSNHLRDETSPYLLQHADNPVDWYPWCSEAFERARKEDKPIFLSIGYSTCHWCHVMARESFEDEMTAEILNRYFIAIKVDREERPDIDSVYMSVCQAFTGNGGWPMSIFMTWEKKPFFAGTYFPVRPRYGMPGFADLLRVLAGHWSSDRGSLLDAAKQAAAHFTKSSSGKSTSGSGAGAEDDLAGRAAARFSDSFDRTYGGFGDAPKFPSPHNLLFLTLYAVLNDQEEVLEMVEKTLLQMRKGGIFDHIGGGFSRYSTDRYFLVPHFEKMLYDNALLIMAYASVYAVTGDLIYLDTAEKTAQYVIREMTASEGGFYSAQDADSEGREGKYYTFTRAEVLDILGPERGGKFADTFDITADGSFEGANIPNLLKSNDLVSDFGDEIQKLYAYRKNRFRLHLDDKILMSWNSLMITALSLLYRVTGKETYLQKAENAQRFLEKNLCIGPRLCTSWREEKCSRNGFLDDYAFYTAALLELYQASLNGAYLERAEDVCREAQKRFADHEAGGFYLSDPNDTDLFMNPKEVYDGAMPSGNSVMAYNFVKLCQLVEKEEYEESARKQIAYMTAQAQDNPAGHGMFLSAKLLYDNPPEHITVVLKDSADLEEIKGKIPLSADAVVVPESAAYPLLNDRTTFYVCRDHVCLPPVNI